VIFLYTGSSEDYTWNQLYSALDPEYVASHYTNVDNDGRRFRWDNLTGPGGAAKGNPYYEVLGVKAYWRYTEERMKALVAEGRVAIPPRGKVPALKRYLDESKGTPLQSVWDDLPPVNSQAKEALGYPTQKPVALLERIIKASSNPNDVILDAFCGCGTALVAAEQLNRQWIGIDVSPTACRVMGKRLKDVCRLQQNEALWYAGRGFVIRNLPWSEKKLREIPPFEFENWAVISLGGVANKAKVGDMGIDGRIFFPVNSLPKEAGSVGQLDYMDNWYPIQVKQKDKVGRPDIDAFEAVMMRVKPQKGVFISFDYSSDATEEITAFFNRTHKVIVPLTVKEILDGDFAMKLA
jgi:site-specific DNA-methyltransferase (adenine-specific)